MNPTCPYCQSPRTRAERCESGPHYARLVCEDCRRHIRWLPRPEELAGAMPAAVRARIHPRAKPAPFRGGTPRQRSFAENVRRTLLWKLYEAKLVDVQAMAMCVTDPTWFIAQQHRKPDALRWPRPDQMEGPESYGSCVQCGAPAYDGEACCSGECYDEQATRVALRPHA